MQYPPIPNQTPISTELRLPQSMRGSLVHQVWVDWLRGLAEALGLASIALGSATGAAQTAAIPQTAVQTQQPLQAGLYRVSWYLRVVTPASVSSSVTVTIRWTDGGVVCSASGGAVAGNLTTSVQSGSLLIQIDGNTSITYQTAYASVGTPMGYTLRVVVESL